MVQAGQGVIYSAFEGARSGADNMARDLELFDAVARGELDIAFRTYTWQPWAVSLGKNQREGAIHSHAAALRGYDVVRRPTGGRAVLHANELTYCIVVRSNQPRTVYAQIHTMLQVALDPLSGYKLSQEAEQVNLHEHYAASTSLGQICFSASAHSEIQVDGRKVVGSAQRVTDGIILQHGSILCGPEHEQIVELIDMDDADRPLLRETLRTRSISLSEIAGRNITAEECAAAIHDGAEAMLLRMFEQSSPRSHA